MQTLTLTQRRGILAKAWKNYVTIRRAYCNRKATVQQLAHALALVGVAEVKAEIAIMNDSSIPPRSIRVAVERIVRYYVMVGIDGAILAGPFDDKHEAFKAKRKFLRHQREEKKRKEKLQP